MAFDPTTAILVSPTQSGESSKFDSSTAVLVNPVLNPAEIQTKSQSSNILNEVANSPIVKTINAAGGGVQEALANTVGSLPFSSKDNAEALSPPGFVKQEMDQNPIAATAGKVAGYIAPAAAMTGGISAAISPVVKAGSFLNQVTANSIAGSMLAGEGNRMLGGAIGAAAGAVAPAVTSVANYINKAYTVKSQLYKTVSEINQGLDGTPDQVAAKSQSNVWNLASATENKMVESFKSNTVSTIPENAANQAAQILNKYNDPKQLGNLSNDQEGLLKQIIQWSKDKTEFSVEELHKTRKSLDQLISQAFNKADNGEISRDIATSLNSLRKPLEQDLQQAATKANVLDKYLEFNKYYKDTVLPLMNTGAKDTAEALTDNTDPLTAAKITDGLIDKYIKPGKPDIAKTFLATLDDTGKQAVEAQVVNNFLKKATTSADELDPVIFNKNLSEFRKTMNGVFSPNTSKMLDGLQQVVKEGTLVNMSKIGTSNKIFAGLGIGAGLMHTMGAPVTIGAGLVLTGLHKLMTSKVGQDILIRAGSPGGKEIGKQIVNAILLKSALEITPKDSEESIQTLRNMSPTEPAPEQAPPTQTIGLRS